MARVEPERPGADDWADGKAPEGIVPPCDLGAEMAVCAMCMVDGPKYMPGFEWLKPFHFFSEANRRVFEACCWLKLNGKIDGIDSITVAAFLNETKRLAQVGGMEYMASIVTHGFAVEANPLRHAEIVYEKWRVRETIMAAKRIAARGYDQVITEDVQRFIDDAIAPFVALSRDAPNASLLTADKLAGEQLAQMVESSKKERTGKLVGLPTGIKGFDLQTGGMAYSAQTVYQALYGKGKSSVGLQVAAHTAGFRGLYEPVSPDAAGAIFFSGEMKRAEQIDRLTAMIAGVEVMRLKLARVEPTLTVEEWTRIRIARALVRSMPLFFSDNSDLSLAYMRTQTLQACDRGMRSDGKPVKLVVTDYYQRMKTISQKAESRHSDMTRNAEGLTELAKETGCAFLTLAQMNTPDRKESPGGKPYRGLTFECKAVEKEANQLIAPWQPDLKNDPLRTILIVLKGREGTEGVEQECRFDPVTGRLYDPAYEGTVQNTFGNFQ